MKPKRRPGNTLNHTISKKGSMLEFEKWFVDEFGGRPNGLYSEHHYDIAKSAARKAWLAREKVY